MVNAAFALDPASPPLFADLGDDIARPHSRHEFGDVASTFANADRVIDFHIDVHRQQNMPPWRDAAASQAGMPAWLP